MQQVMSCTACECGYFLHILLLKPTDMTSMMSWVMARSLMDETLWKPNGSDMPMVCLV